MNLRNMLLYRKELDGLRALAVLAVIIYHANITLFGLKLFQGGYFGVDVFFVLSGYLITGIIRQQMDNNTFAFADFYWRRAKRIVPALLTMLLVTSAVAYAIMLPEQLVTYAKSLQSALYFGSNHYFFTEDSYVAEASIYKPLLHTWSLAVEWQFYVVFPVLIYFIQKYFKKYVFEILLVLALISLQFADFIVANAPDMAFYLLPSRAWELILGGLATFYNRDNINKLENGSLESFFYRLLPLIGLFLITHSLLFIGHEVDHPSFITLIPVLGTLLFIMFAHKGEITCDIFSLKPIVGIGLISYSLYLWHQPVFVFFRLMKYDQFRLEQVLLLILISMILSFLTYKYVENPFRQKQLRPSAIGALTSLFFITLSFSVLTLFKNGFPERLGPVASLFQNLNDNTGFKIEGKTCHDKAFGNGCDYQNDGGRNILLVGDSHSGTIGRHLFLLSKKEQWNYKQVTIAGCTGINTVVRKSGNHAKIHGRCLRQAELISKYIENENSPRYTIVFASRLQWWLSGTRFDNTLGGIEEGSTTWLESTNDLTPSESITAKLNYWKSLGHKLVLIYPVPEVGWHVPKLVNKKLSQYLFASDKAKAYEQLEIATPYKLYKHRTKEAFKVLDNVEGEGIIRVYPDKVLCDQTKCFANDKKHLFYYDDDHLSTYGAKMLVNEIEKSMLSSIVYND